MAMNPMQRKSRNSFLLGMVLTLLITSIIIAFLFLQLTKLKQEADELEKSYVSAYVVLENISSGDEIIFVDKPSEGIKANIKKEKISKNMLPEDYLNLKQFQEIENSIKDVEQKEIKKIAKIDLAQGTVLTGSVMEDSEEKTTKDIRLQEYNMLVLPTQLEAGDYIDVRWMLPNGQDYVVLSKKRVIDCNEDTIWIKMDEGEILSMSSAIVEAYTVTGSKLYAIKYVEPGYQETAVPTYMPNNDVTSLILADSNITEEAEKKLKQRYSDAVKKTRQENIQSVLEHYSENSIDNIEAKLEEEIARQQEARQMYLDQLDASM